MKSPLYYFQFCNNLFEIKAFENKIEHVVRCMMSLRFNLRESRGQFVSIIIRILIDRQM